MPIWVLIPTVTVMTEVPEPGAGIVVGLKLTVVPDGAPVADRVIELLKPLLMVAVIVEVPCVPCKRVSDIGEAARVKLPAAVTVRVTVVVC